MPAEISGDETSEPSVRGSQGTPNDLSDSDSDCRARRLPSTHPAAERAGAALSSSESPIYRPAESSTVQRCRWCYRRIGSFQAAQEQHERFSEKCLRWQFYLSGATTWGRACARAKVVREERVADSRAAKSMRQLKTKERHAVALRPNKVAKPKKEKKNGAKGRGQPALQRLCERRGCGSSPVRIRRIRRRIPLRDVPSEMPHASLSFAYYVHEAGV